MTALTHLTLAQARDGLDAKDFTARDLAEAHIAAYDIAKSLNLYVTETPEKALAMADASDARRAAGEVRGALDGAPIAVKDMFCTQGVRTTASSRILGDFVPSYESTVTAKCWEAGALLLGKTGNDEFAMGSSNMTSCFGPVENPWRRTGDDKPLTPGGSSGGSAAAVAARAALAALGTDTGGSIRQPAAFCGIVGAKPTYGRCSRWGVIAFASSLDQAGPLTRTVRDAAIMLNAICGFDPKDTTSAEKNAPDFEAAVGKSIRGLRIGVPIEYRVDGMNPEAERLWQTGVEWVKAAGAEPVEIGLPHTKYALPAYYIVNPAEASSNLARYDGVRYGLRVEGKDIVEMYENTRGEGFGDEVKRRVLIGAYVLSAGYYDAYYIKAQKVRRLISRDFDNAFKTCDAILTPTTPNAAFAIGEAVDDPIQMYLNDVFTVTVNMAGLPAISAPAGLSGDGLPLGLQVIGRPWDEETMLSVAQVLEDAAGFEATPQAMAG